MKKHILLYLICCSLLMASLPAMAQNGFTNKAEAKNKMKNGIKDGKWIEYLDGNQQVTTGTPEYYSLAEYKDIDHQIEKCRKILSNCFSIPPVYGTRRIYYMSGILYKEVPYATDPHHLYTESGVVKAYYKSGALWYEIPYINGVEKGVEKEYYENGKLLKEKPYPDGKRTGVEKAYFESGQLQMETPYTDSRIDGMEKVYFASGKLRSENPYTDSRIIGVAKEYYESGKLQKETPYANGQRSGLAKTYYENGKIHTETPFTDGNINGLRKEYFETGALSEETLYSNGKREGVQKKYDEKGTVISELMYVDDKKTADLRQSPQDILNSYVKELSKAPADDTLLHNKIISFVHAMSPPPAIPEDANRHLVMGKTAAKLATDASGFADAIAEYRSATLAAPWLGITYFDLAVVQESAHDYTSAMRNYKFYLLAEPQAADAADVKTRIYELEYKAELASKKQAVQDQAAAAEAEKKKQTRQVLDQLKALAGSSEYWWYIGSVGDYLKGGRFGLNMNEVEKGANFWSWGAYRSKYIFKDDKVYICQYASRDLTTGREIYTDLNPDRATLIGTPNGPKISDMTWENIPSYDPSGKPLYKKQVWVHINESNGDIYYSLDRPLTNPDRTAVYNYWWYTKK